MRIDTSVIRTVLFVGDATNGPFVPYGTAFVPLTRYAGHVCVAYRDPITNIRHSTGISYLLLMKPLADGAAWDPVPADKGNIPGKTMFFIRLPNGSYIDQLPTPQRSVGRDRRGELPDRARCRQLGRGARDNGAGAGRLTRRPTLPRPLSALARQ
jgi:hypothetical protein